MSDSQQKLQKLSTEYQQIQDDLQSTLLARQKLESQLEENRSVHKEFQSLPSESNIYKLVGPVLLRQEKDEANGTVQGRLEFIDKEIKRVEGSVKELQGKGEDLRGQIGAVQQQQQQQQQQQEQGQPGDGGGDVSGGK